ncbi:MAG: hypothetical protein J6X55_14950, partial [Victivallales bacterium]|nr:hypothetical protein [Victivallales bacterium]
VAPVCASGKPHPWKPLVKKRKKDLMLLSTKAKQIYYWIVRFLNRIILVKESIIPKPLYD